MCIRDSAYTNAYTYASTRIGVNQVPTGFPYYVDLTDQNDTWQEISTKRTETANVTGGSYSITENFKIGSGVYPWSHQRRMSFDVDHSDIVTIDINGTVQGFGRTNIGPSGNIGFDNAVSGWINHVKPGLHADAAKFYSDLGYVNGLNSDAVSHSVAQIEFAGRVEYGAQFTDNPAGSLPSGISERKVTYNRQDPIEVIAWHAIPFRALGDIKQEMGTPTRGMISISANARAKYTGNIETDVNRAIALVESDINAVRPDPNTAEFTTLELSGPPVLNYDPVTLSASASVNYTFTLDIAGVNSSSGDLTFSRYGGGL